MGRSSVSLLGLRIRWFFSLLDGRGERVRYGYIVILRLYGYLVFERLYFVFIFLEVVKIAWGRVRVG